MKDINLKGIIPAAILPMSANYQPILKHLHDILTG
jgi:hypothetical protein